MRYLFIYILIAFTAFSCKKDKPLPKEPSIELVSVTPTNIEQFTDSIEVTIKYKDGDGNLGDVSPDVYSLMVKDSRLVNADWYHIPPLAPLDVEIRIEGTLKIKLNTMFLLGNGSQEFATLTIKLKDRTGNWSNEIITPQIIINDTL
ncbi:MAG: hypothetical protein V4608_10190 [Bacteroidota bacterium]